MIEPILKKFELYESTVMRATENKKRRVLFKLGAYVRTTMKRSIRVSKKSSLPGQPPRARSSKSPLRQLIEFAVDLQRESVSAGPQKFSASKVRSSKPLPQLLNEGGTTQVLLASGKSVLAQVRPRPFTDQAMETRQARFIELIESEQLKD